MHGIVNFDHKRGFPVVGTMGMPTTMPQWKREYENNCAIPETVAHFIEACDQDLYPDIKTFLLILETPDHHSYRRYCVHLRKAKTSLRASMP
ncbi:hypothetical protein EVAR_83534_1 [Eumeta japonica]|uniref:Uncharacterized protein n=1 Tax=Eumeta variegata TaxID=151549 RepID=A0A4C1ZAV0_EUMVA|nr:hypothetical protein EVAR_83534_1 [Eumeta japonica]